MVDDVAKGFILMVSDTLTEHKDLLGRLSLLKEEQGMDHVKFKRLSENAIIPTKDRESDSGFDLYAAEDIVIEPGHTEVVPTNISVQLPEGCEAQVRPRSGMTAKTKLRVQLGTIDNGFSGDIGIIVDNTGDVDHNMSGGYVFNVKKEVQHISERLDEWDSFKEGSYLIRKGNKIAQLVPQLLPQAISKEVSVIENNKSRGSNGFGSSGI